MKTMIMNHYKKYPQMQLEDMIKLVYQQCFGPAHLYDIPSLETVTAYLEKEQKDFKDHKTTDTFEAIGNHYVRVSLRAIHDNTLPLYGLATMFYESMLTSPLMDAKTLMTFRQGLDTIIDLVEKKTIDYSLEDTLDFLNDYLEKGIRPIHHSEIYRQHYHPHYRVVHKEYISL